MTNSNIKNASLNLQNISTSRRSFIKKASVVGAGLMVGIPLVSCAKASFPNEKALNEQQVALQPNALLQITADNTINFYLPRSEMGQGISTGLTTIVLYL